MSDQEMAKRTTILCVPAGSTLHGLHIPGTDDRDEIAVCIEDIDAMVGFSEFEQYIYRTAAEREGKHDAPSHAGDLDLTIFSLRKFLRLAMQGNPQIIQCLFVPSALCVLRGARGAQLQELAPLIVSRRAGARYLGYLEAQRQRLLGERGQKKVNRPELEDKYGFDCYADDTEFLTRHGWKLYDEIADGEAVATIHPAERSIEFQVPTERVSKPYNGEMLDVRQRYSAARVTPNHRMWVSKVQRGPSGIHGDSYRDDAAEWRFARADALAALDRVHVQVSGAPRPAEYAIGDNLLRLVGAYVSEGCIAKRLKSGQPSVVALSQNVGNRLEAVIEASGYPFRRFVYARREAWRRTECESATYTLADRQLAAMLSSDCGEGSRLKHLPSWAFDLSARQGDILLDSLMAGDGTVYKRTGYRIYYTLSRRLAGDVQALAITAGYRSNMWGPYQSGMYQVLVAGGPMYQALGGRTHVRRAEAAPRRIVCFTVPNETLVTRRDGRVAMHGNTKYAMHILRLGFQGVELMTTGRLTLPMPEKDRAFVYATRLGHVPLQDVLTKAGELEREIKDLLHDSPIPAEPAREQIQAWMIRVYFENWKARDTSWIGAVRT